MIIKYDKNLRVVGLGIAPWSRLGPEKWLNKYKIASLYGWDLPANTRPTVKSLVAKLGYEPKLKKLNTQSVINNRDFQLLLEDFAPDYSILTYKPITPPKLLKNRQFLNVDTAVASLFENKVEFREKMNSILNFPVHEVYQRDNLKKSQGFYQVLLGKRKKIVIQDEQLSGGKGTYIVDSYSKYLGCLDSLNRLSMHERVVISDVIDNAMEISIQACVTKYGVFCGPLQQQLVNDELLANTKVPDGDKFSAVQIDIKLQNSPLHDQAIEVAKIVGDKLQKEGYSGIFGVDFLVNASGELYILEVNPRITGATPLLTALYKEKNSIPFYLLHILELGKYDYSILDKSYSYTDQGSLMILHSQETETSYISSTPRSGTYTINNGQMELVNRSIDLLSTNSEQFIVEEYMPTAMRIKPGGRLLVVKTRNLVMDNNRLTDDSTRIVKALYNNIKLSETLSTSNNEKQLQVIGKAEYLDLVDFETNSIPSRIDTGARTSAIWASSIEEKNDNLEVVFFGQNSPFYSGKKEIFSKYTKMIVRPSTGEEQERYVISLVVRLNGRKIRARFTLADRSKQSYPVLVGRNILRGKFLVDPSRGIVREKSMHTGTQSIQEEAK